MRENAYFDDADVWLLSRVIDWYLGYPFNPVLNRVRYVRDNLYGLAEVLPFSLRRVSSKKCTGNKYRRAYLFFYDFSIDLASRYVVIA